MRNTFSSWLTREAETMNSFLISGDLGFGVFEEFRKLHPNRFINAGVAEQSMIGIASGLSSLVGRVFVYSIGNFASLRCLEQIRNDISYMNSKVTIVSVGSGFSYGAQGYTHHAIEDIAALRAIPNLNLYCPADEVELTCVLSEVRESQSPSFIRLGRGGESRIHELDPKIDISAPIKVGEGKDGIIFFAGPIGSEVLKAKDRLFEMGIFPSIYSCPRLSPGYDYYGVIKERDFPAVLVVEEHVKSGALMSSILESLIGTNVNLSRYCQLAINENLIHQLGNQDYLRKMHQIDAQTITKRFLSLIN
jgi:transketolase